MDRPFGKEVEAAWQAAKSLEDEFVVEAVFADHFALNIDLYHRPRFYRGLNDNGWPSMWRCLRLQPADIHNA